MKNMYIKIKGTRPYTHKSHAGFKIVVNPNCWVGIPGCFERDYKNPETGKVNEDKYKLRLEAYKEEKRMLEQSSMIYGPFDSEEQAIAWEKKTFPENFPEEEKPLGIIEKITGKSRKKRKIK